MECDGADTSTSHECTLHTFHLQYIPRLARQTSRRWQGRNQRHVCTRCGGCFGPGMVARLTEGHAGPLQQKLSNAFFFFPCATGMTQTRHAQRILSHPHLATQTSQGGALARTPPTLCLGRVQWLCAPPQGHPLPSPFWQEGRARAQQRGWGNGVSDALVSLFFFMLCPFFHAVHF